MLPHLLLAYLAIVGAVCTDATSTQAAFAGVMLPGIATGRFPRGSTARSCWRSRRYCAGGGAGDDGRNEGGPSPPPDKSSRSDYAPLDNRGDHMVSAVSGNGQVVVRAITARSLVQDALVRQNLHPLVADALGRVMICTMLMAGGLKDQETFQLIFSGSGPLGGVVSISDGEGGIRGYVTNGQVDLPLKDNGNQDVATGIGQGLLKVVRNHPDYSSPYMGITALKSGEVAYDAAAYMAESEQKSCAIAAGCFVTGAVVRQAGGYILETLPDASEDTERIVVNNIAKLLNKAEDPSELLGRGLTPVTMVETMLDGLGGVGAITYKQPRFLCHCTDERVYRALRLLERSEVEDMLKKREDIEVKCEFCGKEYHLSPEQVERELDWDPREDGQEE